MSMYLFNRSRLLWRFFRSYVWYFGLCFCWFCYYCVYFNALFVLSRFNVRRWFIYNAIYARNVSVFSGKYTQLNNVFFSLAQHKPHTHTLYMHMHSTRNDQFDWLSCLSNLMKNQQQFVAANLFENKINSISSINVLSLFVPGSLVYSKSNIVREPQYCRFAWKVLRQNRWRFAWRREFEVSRVRCRFMLLNRLYNVDVCAQTHISVCLAHYYYYCYYCISLVCSFCRCYALLLLCL